ncbi:MAG: hypothetical protein ACOYL6_14490 [Bacteriovoracaceae bacterium]
MREIFLGSLIFAISMTARAHFQIGTYKGTTADGTTCELQVKGVSFNYNIKNQLNERVEVVFNDETFLIGHAPLFNATTNEINADHSTLNAFKGISTGAKHFSLHMEDGREGPSEFFMVNHNWKTNSAIKIECTKLEFVTR